jgi:pSer/pThr/pTyr-binding forkhead associated (FHA) protein
MGVTLEIRGGTMGGKVIAVPTGHSVTVGRANGRAEVALPQDTFMSGLHFAVECSASGCRVVDRKSSNGTFLNGARIQDAMLANGDEIKAGQTVFAVRILSDEKLAGVMSSQSALVPPATNAPAAGSSPVLRPPVEAQIPLATPRGKTTVPTHPSAKDAAIPATPALSAAPAIAANASAGAGGPERSAVRAREFAVLMMGWSFRSVPPKWQVQEGLGLQSEEGEFPSSVAVTQESLGGIALQQFVEFQINMLKGYLREAKIEPALPPPVSGAEETIAVDVRHKTNDGRELVYRRIYARRGAAVGVLTITALASEMEQVLQRLGPVLEGAEFREGR